MCWAPTTHLTQLMDEADRRGAWEVHLVDTWATFILKPPSGPVIRRMEKFEFLSEAGTPVRADEVVSGAMSSAELFMSALGEDTSQKFHFDSPINPNLLSRWRRERLVEGFCTVVEAEVTWSPFLQLTLRRPSSVAVGPLIRGTGMGRPPRSVVRRHLAAAQSLLS